MTEPLAVALGATAAAPTTLEGDFNELSLANLVRLAGNKGQWQNLRREVEKLKKRGNEKWLDLFKKKTCGRDYRELVGQEWYPR